MPDTRAPPHDAIARLLHGLYIGGDGGSGDRAALREEDEKKVLELAALLPEIARLPRRTVVDAACGHAYAGLFAAALAGPVESLHLIERDDRRAARARGAAERLARLDPRVPAPTISVGDVADPARWPDAPDLVLALHACGPASDAVVDATSRARARALLLVPCCHARSVSFAAFAEARCDALGLPRHAELRRPVIESLIQSERALRLERAGYEVTLVAFVPKRVTPENVLFRARRKDDPTRMAAAARAYERLTRSVIAD